MRRKYLYDNDIFVVMGFMTLEKLGYSKKQVLEMSEPEFNQAMQELENCWNENDCTPLIFAAIEQVLYDE